MAKLIKPLLEMYSPVSAGLLGPAPNRRFKVAEGVDVSLPAGSACHPKVWLMAEFVPLLNTEATSALPCEFAPLAAVAVAVADRLSVPRTVTLPFTSRAETGVVLLIPILAVPPTLD